MIDASDTANTTVFERYSNKYKRLKSTMSARGRMRDQIWQPRYADHGDYVLGRWVFRVSRSCYEVAFLEFQDYSRLPKGNALKTVLLFMLSDAYLGSGNMSIRFCGPQSGAKPTLQTGFMNGIPDEIVELAKSFGITLTSTQGILDQEGRKLYIHLSDLSDLIDSKCVDPFYAALVRNRGIWKNAQIEGMSRFALEPQALLLGENKQRYGFGLLEQHDRQVLLYLLMREHIERILRRLDYNPYRSVIAERSTDQLSCLTFTISDSLEFSSSVGNTLILQAKEQVAVRLFPWPLLTLEVELENYLQEELNNSQDKTPLIFVFPLEARSLNPKLWSMLETVCAQTRTACFILEDSYSNLKREVTERLARASTTLRAGPGIIDD